MKHRLTIVTPVFNDWDCLVFLLKDISQTLQNEVSTIRLIAVNDSSIQGPNQAIDVPDNIIFEQLNLVTNVGHQRAILIGLCYCLDQNYDSDYIIVMDSDGEDKPEYILDFLKKVNTSNKEEIVFAKRVKRSESLSFRVFYQLYKITFRLLTGSKISFGNFSCIPKSLLAKICNEPNFWNHYSAAMIKSGLPYSLVPTVRGQRYFGKSKMNINSLILHGLSSLSVYIESIIIRALKLSFSMFLLLGIVAAVVVFVKYFTNYAIPGWATYVFGFIFNLFATIGLFNLLILLMHLSNRNKPLTRLLDFYKSLLQD